MKTCLAAWPLDCSQSKVAHLNMLGSAPIYAYIHELIVGVCGHNAFGRVWQPTFTYLTSEARIFILFCCNYYQYVLIVITTIDLNEVKEK